MDEPALLVPEWERKGAEGRPDPLLRRDLGLWAEGRLRAPRRPRPARRASSSASPIPAICAARCRRRPSLTRYPKITKQPFILVTTGGGGDGDDLIDWVISAYEADPDLEHAGADPVRPVHQPGPAPLLHGAHRPQPKLDAMSFDTKIELLMEKADADRRHGRLQHLLRDPVPRQARPDRAAHPAAAGAVYPRRRGASGSASCAC